MKKINLIKVGILIGTTALLLSGCATFGGASPKIQKAKIPPQKLTYARKEYKAAMSYMKDNYWAVNKKAFLEFENAAYIGFAPAEYWYGYCRYNRHRDGSRAFRPLGCTQYNPRTGQKLIGVNCPSPQKQMQIDNAYYNATFRWVKKAALQGYIPAEDKLGTLYWMGRGCQKNFAMARFWWTAAYNEYEKYSNVCHPYKSSACHPHYFKRNGRDNEYRTSYYKYGKNAAGGINLLNMFHQ